MHPRTWLHKPWIALGILTLGNLVLTWNLWRAEGNYHALQKTSDTCIASLQQMVNGLPTTHTWFELFPAGWGLPQTCTKGDIARDLNHPDTLYLCETPETPTPWRPFVFPSLTR